MNFLIRLLLIALCLGAPPARSEAQPLHLLSRESFNDKTFRLSDTEWRWLGTKRELKVAVWQPEIPPLGMFDGNNHYEGMIADYIVLVAQSLGVRATIERYPDREAALAALEHNAVDMVVNPSGKPLAHRQLYRLSDHFIGDHPVLVHRKGSDSAPFVYTSGMRLAIAGWYVDDSWLEEHFPDAKLEHFANDEQAMASVAFGANDFYVGNLMTASWLLERNFSHYLTLQQVYPERDTGSHFVLRKSDTLLQNAVNRALEALPRTQNQVILQQWSERANLWRVSKQVEFTAAEKKWLARHPTVNVSVNAFYAPFTMIDVSGHFYGVTADILRLIRLRTGIHFEPVPAHSVEEMDSQIADNKASLIGAVTHSEKRSETLLFTRPYFSSPFVLILPRGKTLSAPLPAGTRVAVTAKNSLIASLKAQNPGIEIIETANASLAMQMVDDGGADVAVHTLFGASYMIERYFRDRLKIGGQIGNEAASVAFAVSRSQPELQSILTKALENIAPADINNIIDKWQTRPDVRLDTWALYKTRFWLVSIVAGIIILTSLIWIYYLRREVQARLLAQQKLQSQLEHNEMLALALQEESERAEQANRAKSTFLATMSHEIRTPVSAIIGLLELAVSTAETEPDEEDPVRVAWESARTLMGLIGDILDMARIESGRLELAPEWVRPTELLPPVVRVFEGLARQKSLRLRCTLSPQLSAQIYIDPLRFRQVVSNLISNAIKFTDRGSVNVEMTLEAANPSGKSSLTVRVTDTGKGIALEEQRDIFDPWVQAENGHVMSGSGLGLAICAQLVTMMDGDITLSSQAGLGTTVRFTLPVSRSVETPPTPPAPEKAEIVPRRSLRILAVDDHPANRMLLRRQLALLGHQVTEANDGEQAWAIWQAARFDVVITDCSMPGMDGLALTRLIRQHQTTEINIFGLTANASPEERHRCIEAGMDDCLFKPLQLPQLQALLDGVNAQVPAPGIDDLLDVNRLLELCHDNKNLLGDLLRVTLKTNHDDLQRAREAFQQKRWPKLAKYAHSLSGAAQIAGADKTVSACRLLETLCKTEEDEDIETGWQAAEEAVIELNRAIERWLAAA